MLLVVFLVVFPIVCYFCFKVYKYCEREAIRKACEAAEVHTKKYDFSFKCNLDDDDMSNPCLICNKFCFPIGCMVGEQD